ncbi:MAG: hypothetical protein D6814_06090 [Calditrichaeota bacterium]|nr:MAG: hypothetical protein D6814_06090 [Calditrichota bacterium]
MPKCQICSYIAVLQGWLLLLVFSACSPTHREMRTLQMSPILQFSGRHAAGHATTAPLADICVDRKGNFFTLLQDTGRVTCFDSQGREICSFALFAEKPESRSGIEAVSLAVGEGEVYVVDSRHSSIQVWTPEGRYLRSVQLSFPLGPGDTTVTGTGEVFYNSEGFPDSSLVIEFDARGKVSHRIGFSPQEKAFIPRTHSLKQAIARRRIPLFLRKSVLLATGPDRRLYVLYRTRPVLQCFAGNRLVFQRQLNFPELADIEEAILVRNRVLQVPNAYIPFSYWSDIKVDEKGRIYILLALQTHQTVYCLDANGRVLAKLIGIYGKGHLLAVRDSKLTIANAASGEVAVYALPF